jgi:hypothetical protein
MPNRSSFTPVSRSRGFGSRTYIPDSVTSCAMSMYKHTAEKLRGEAHNLMYRTGEAKTRFMSSRPVQIQQPVVHLLTDYDLYRTRSLLCIRYVEVHRRDAQQGGPQSHVENRQDLNTSSLPRPDQIQQPLLHVLTNLGPI